MRLSKTSEYAIRVLSFMATSPERQVFSVMFIHQELEIPYKYLTKIMRMLSQAGMVAATQGREGGFSFAKPLASIKLTEIVAAVEKNADESPCILGFRYCNDQKPCALHPFWLKPKSAIDEMMLGVTLADLDAKSIRKV